LLAKNYFLSNLFSLGYATFLRKRLIKLSDAKQKETVVDFMSGQGDLFDLMKGSTKLRRLNQVDFSKQMINRSEKDNRVENFCDDITSFEPSEKVDLVISSFGLKTLSEQEINDLAYKTKSSLKDNGEFYFIEFSFNFFEYLFVGCYLFILIVLSSLFYSPNAIYHFYFLRYSFLFNDKTVISSFKEHFENIEVKRYPGAIFISGKK